MDTELKNTISPNQAWHYRIVPDSISIENSLVCKVDEKKLHEELQTELEVILNRPVKLKPETSKTIDHELAKHYSRSNKDEIIEVDISKPESALENIITEAYHLRSSDIHIEPRETNCLIRYRVDGKLLEKYVIQKSAFGLFINKIKILSKLDISEKRLPQDGRLKLKIDKGDVDVRVSTLPTLFGEKAVLRILKKDANHLEMESLGMSESQSEIFNKSISQNQGLILISGPTGSGKTTTLYTALKKLNTPSKNILTIEDPIEYTLQGLNQVQLKEKINLDYPRALRSFLRQDPDIIMVGEIRDADTASMAFRASMTGHLVLSTIHTNSSWETIERLDDLGIPRFSIASTLILSVAQRLVRKLCTHCKVEQKDLPKSDMDLLKSFSIKLPLYKGAGCSYCQYTGYQGRVAIYEMFSVDKDVRDYIKSNRPQEFLFNNKGISSLKDQVIYLVNNGLTSLNESLPLLLAS